MKGHRERLVVATAAVLFGVVFGILFLACEQREDEPDARAGAPASAEAKPDAGADAPASAKVTPDSPPAPSAPKAVAEGKHSFNDIHSGAQRLGKRIEGFREMATGDLEAVFRELEAEQAQLMAELEAIGGENEKWDAARAELVAKAFVLRGQVRQFAGRVNE